MAATVELIGKRSAELIWNKGIAALCDHRLPDEFPDGKNYSHLPTLAGALFSSKLPDDVIPDATSFANIRDGELVWLRLSWLKSFVKQILPLINAKIVLVTGDSDSCVPSEVGKLAKAIVESPKIIHWYTQNYDGSLAKDRISPLPIGIDFHMLSEKPMWGEQMAQSGEQEQELLSIRQSLPPLVERIPRVYVDFSWQRFHPRHHRLYHPLKGTQLREGRWRLGRKMRKNKLAVCQSGPLRRSEMWRQRGRYAFVLSPHGNGLDCHRTWEALALGHTVLVPSSSLDELYVDLPVVPLQSWDEITSENLAKWMTDYPHGADAHERLRSKYWIEKMRSAAKQRSKTQADQI
jgi:hypothetical protein